MPKRAVCQWLQLPHEYRLNRTDVFATWLRGIRDTKAKAKARIFARLDAARNGKLGDWRSAGGGIAAKKSDEPCGAARVRKEPLRGYCASPPASAFISSRDRPVNLAIFSIGIFSRRAFRTTPCNPSCRPSCRPSCNPSYRASAM